MKVVVACDSFKGSLGSQQVNDAVARGILREYPAAEVVQVEIGDGGEGTLQMLVRAYGGSYAECMVSDPLMRPVKARYGIARRDGHDVAIIEMAQASGLTLLAEDERNPLLTTSHGTGELIADAYGRGCREFVVGIGGSATNDGGTGMLEALGVLFADRQGRALPKGGGALADLAAIDVSQARHDILQCPFTIVCDVNNPLLGEQGASAVFGPQKGASAPMVSELENALAVYADIAQKTTGRDIRYCSGAGAAGGMGAAFLAFFNARLLPGIETTLQAIGFEKTIAGASLVITGEGCLDAQSLHGKAPQGVLRMAWARGIPAVAIGGAVKDVPQLLDAGFAAVLCVQQRALPLAQAMAADTATESIYLTARQIARLFFR